MNHNDEKNEKTKWTISLAVCAGIVLCVCIVLFAASIMGGGRYSKELDSKEENTQNNMYNRQDKAAGQGDMNNSGYSLESKNKDDNINDNEEASDKSGMSSRTAVEGYFVVEDNGCVIIYKGDNREFYDYAEINMDDVPDDVKKELKKGMNFKDSAELYDFLQTYSS